MYKLFQSILGAVLVVSLFGSAAYCDSAKKAKRAPSSLDALSQDDPSSSSNFKIRIVWGKSDTSTAEGKEAIAKLIEGMDAGYVSCINTLLSSFKDQAFIAARDDLMMIEGVSSASMVIDFTAVTSDYEHLPLSINYVCNSTNLSGDSINRLCPEKYGSRISACAGPTNFAAHLKSASNSARASIKAREKEIQDKKNVRKNLDDLGAAPSGQNENSDRSM